jgi:Ice-binding-like
MSGLVPFFFPEKEIQAKDHVSPRALGFTQAAILRFPEVALTAGGLPALASAGTFAVLGASTVTNSGASVVSGNLGLYPGTAIVGFPPGTVINGSIHDTDTIAAQAQLDLTTAYTALNALAPSTLLPADIGGTTVTPGVYHVATTLAITGTVTLDAGGNPNALFVFQIPAGFNPAVGSTVALINGASAANVYWVTGSSATVGVGSVFQGNILAETSISLNTGVTGSMRLLARTGAVTLLTNVVTLPIATTTTTNTVSARIPLPVGVKILAVEVLPFSATPGVAIAGSVAFNIVDGPIAYEGAVPAQGLFLITGASGQSPHNILSVIISGTLVTTGQLPVSTEAPQAAVALAAAINANGTLAALGTAYPIGAVNGASVVSFVDNTPGTSGNGIAISAVGSPSPGYPGNPGNLSVTTATATMNGGAAAGAVPVIATTDSSRAGITPPNTALVGQALFATDQVVTLALPDMPQPFYPTQFDAIFPKNSALTLRLAPSSTALGSVAVSILVQVVDMNPQKPERTSWAPSLSSY